MALNSRLTTGQIEARDTTLSPLVFTVHPNDLDDLYEVGQDVVVNAKDGGVFIGHVEDSDEDTGRIFVELD